MALQVEALLERGVFDLVELAAGGWVSALRYESEVSHPNPDPPPAAAQVEALLERGVFDMAELAAGGWVTALRYEDELVSDLKKRTGGKADKVRAVGCSTLCP